MARPYPGARKDEFEDGGRKLVSCAGTGYELRTGANPGSPEIRLKAARLEEKEGNVHAIV